MKEKLVFVLILTYNGKHLLKECIESYLNNTYTNFKVIVIDNASTDETKEYVEKEWSDVEVLRTDTDLKYSGGFNLGLRYAFEKHEADYVLITNNDVKADNNIIKACVNKAEKDKMTGFVIGKVYYYDQPDTIQTCGRTFDEKNLRGKTIGLNEKDAGQYDKEALVPWCDDIFWLVNKDLYDVIGGYDTEFAFQGEDFDWQFRAKKKGFKIYYTPEAKLWHKESMTIGKISATKAYYDFRNPLIVHMKHRAYEEFKYYFNQKRKSLFVKTLKELFNLRVYYVLMCWKGFISAMIWGLQHKKIRIINVILG
jgi:GT2 family glycosyltransferase